MNDQPRMNSQQQDVVGSTIQQMTDQQVRGRYVRELQKLRMLNRYGRHSEHFRGYPNTLVMHCCKRELERRGLPVPPVNPPDATEGGHQNA